MSEQAERERSNPGEPSEAGTARARVVETLRAFELGERDSLDSLYEALCRLVAVLRRAGRTREDVIAEVRNVVTAPATPQGARKVPEIAREALAELTVRWCEEEYART